MHLLDLFEVRPNSVIEYWHTIARVKLNHLAAASHIEGLEKQERGV